MRTVRYKTMHKLILFSLIAFFLPLGVQAKVPFMTHEHFVHLSEKEKHEYLIKVMELVVEIESKYQHETATYGYNEDRFQKYKRVITQIRSQLFISEAHAQPFRNIAPADATYVYPYPFVPVGTTPVQDPKSQTVHRSDMQRVSAPTWNQMAEQFNKLSKNPRSGSEGNCLFAGWVSRMVKDTNGKLICAHPDFIRGSLPTRGITTENQFYPTPKGDCAANKDNKNFVQCNPVIFGYKDPQKQELFCVSTNQMAENSAFNCMKEALKPGPDDPKVKDRLNDLAKRVAANKDRFAYAHEFTLKACVCKSKPNVGFSKDYQDYMRPGAERSETRFRTCYGLVNMIQETNNQCTPENQTLNSNNLSLLSSFKKFLDGKDEKDKSDLAPRIAEEWYKDFITTHIPKDREAAVAYNNACAPDEIPVPEIVTENPRGGNDPSSRSFVCEAKCSSSGTTASSSAGADQAAVETPASGTVGAASGAGLAPGAFTCTFEMKEEGKDDTKRALTATELPQKAEDSEVEITVTEKPDGFTADKINCKIAWAPIESTPATADKKPLELEVKITDKKDTHYKVEATFTEGNLTWKLKGAPDNVPKSWETPTPRPQVTAGSGVGGQGTDGDTTRPTQSDTPVVAGHGKIINQARVATDYQVCGQLQKGEERSGEICVTIDKVGATEAPKPQAPFQNFMGQQQGVQPQMIRAPSDTSAIGIK